MKRTILALLALGAVVASACTKSLDDNFVTITLQLGTESGYFPTKGIVEEIEATLPAQMQITLTNRVSGEAYTAATGLPVRVPVGSYTAVGRTTPTIRQTIYGDTHYATAEPLVVVDEVLEVVADKTAYSVTGQYRCFALVANRSEVSGWKVKAEGEWGILERTTATDVMWTYIVGDYDADHPLRTMAILGDGSALDYTFYTEDLQEGGLLAEFGKWYLLRPAGGAMQTGSLSLRLPEWTAGN